MNQTGFTLTEIFFRLPGQNGWGNSLGTLLHGGSSSLDLPVSIALQDRYDFHARRVFGETYTKLNALVYNGATVTFLPCDLDDMIYIVNQTGVTLNEVFIRVPGSNRLG
jgi:hypothetical protein